MLPLGGETVRCGGHVQPKPMGGDRHSHRMEAHAPEVLALIEATPDLTRAEIAAHLESRHGLAPAGPARPDGQ